MTREASGLFYTLHRAIIYFWILLCLGVLYYVYQKRQVFQPALDYYEVWQASAPEPVKLEHTSGMVFAVPSGIAFQFRNEEGRPYTCTLAGLELPPFRPGNLRDIQFKEKSREALQSMVLSNKVTLDVTYPQGMLALGIVHVGGTNVNDALLREGMAQLHPEFIRTLPIKEQFQMVRAEKLAKEEKVGVWAR